jgi:hypothetical protein
MAFNGLPNPNHDPLMPVTASPALTYCNVNFKVNDDDDSNTPICSFNFGEKENPYPRFNAGIDNIATSKSVRPTTSASTLVPSPTTYAPAPSPATNQDYSAYVQNTSPVIYQVHPVTNQVHPAYAPATVTLPPTPVPRQVHPAYVPASATLSPAPAPPQVHPAYTYAHPHSLVALTVSYP